MMNTSAKAYENQANEWKLCSKNLGNKLCQQSTMNGESQTTNIHVPASN